LGIQSATYELKKERMKAKHTKSALIIGASGLVGKLLSEAILQNDHYVSITLVLRRSIDLKYDKRVKIITISDFDALDQYEEDLFSEDVFCCLGSTMKKAGSKSAFEKSDLIYPLKVATINQKNPNFKNYLIVTSQGANAKSLFYYNQVKGKCEQALLALNLPGLKVFRPSLLLGNRIEKRGAEVFFNFLIQVVSSPLKVLGISSFWSIEAVIVARAMLQVAMTENEGTVFYDAKAMVQLIQ
jgi:nucleoside-diphosphate-sugar epimerase